MDAVPIALKRYAKAQGWPIRIYNDVHQCLKVSKRRIKLMIVNERNLAEIIDATYSDRRLLNMWSRALIEHPGDTVLLFNSPCRLQIAFASTFTHIVLSRDPTVPFECSTCRLMCMSRAPIYCGSCNTNLCDDCYAAVIKQDVDETMRQIRETGERLNPINIYCTQCDAELLGSWSDVYKVAADHSINSPILFLTLTMNMTDLMFFLRNNKSL